MLFQRKEKWRDTFQMYVKQAWRIYHCPTISRDRIIFQTCWYKRIIMKNYCIILGSNWTWIIERCRVTVKPPWPHRRVRGLPAVLMVTLTGCWFPCCFQRKYFLEPGFEFVFWNETRKMFSLWMKQQWLRPSQLLMTSLLLITFFFSTLSVDVDPLESRSLVFLAVDEVDPLESPEDDESARRDSDSDVSSIKCWCL